MNYCIEVLEHDGGPPWTDDVGYSREGAWARVRALARLVADDWPHPIFVRVYLVRKDEKHLVWSEDLRNVRYAAARG